MCGIVVLDGYCFALFFVLLFVFSVCLLVPVRVVVASYYFELL